MTETLKLDAATEAIAVHLLRHLEWQHSGFSLIFLFADVGPASQLAAWLDLRLQLSKQPLQRIEADARFVDAPDAVVDTLMTKLPALSVEAGAVWFGLHRHPADARWNDARRRFIARINERRYLLERDLGRPLILILPSGARAEVAAMAPDLWHIRSSSHLLRAEGAVRDSDLAPAPPWRAQRGPADAPIPAYEEWRRLVSTQQPDQIFLPLSQPAIAALLNAGRPADAAEVAEQARAIASSRASTGTPEALRDLSVSLNNVGDVARAQWDWAQAEAVYRESLELSRQLVERLGGTPEALRDLSVSLDNVGRVARAQGDWAQAEAVYRESLDLSRQRVERLGGTPESLRDLSVSLNSVGHVARVQGEWVQAEAVYRESLDLRRQLVERLGGTPEALDDLATALRNIAMLPGGGSAALAEAAAIYRDLSTRFPAVVRYQTQLSSLETELAAAPPS